MLGGGALAGAGILAGMIASVDAHHGDDVLAIWASLGGLAAVVISSGVRARMMANAERARAFEAYEQSLLEGFGYRPGEVTCQVP